MSKTLKVRTRHMPTKIEGENKKGKVRYNRAKEKNKYRKEN